MNVRQKTLLRVLWPAVLIVATVALPYWLYTQGSPVLMEYALLFLAAFLAAITVALWTWGAGRYAGLVFMSLGVLMLLLLHLFGFTFSNRLLLIGIGLVLTGLFLYVWVLKKESRY